MLKFQCFIFIQIVLCTSSVTPKVEDESDNHDDKLKTIQKVEHKSDNYDDNLKTIQKVQHKSDNYDDKLKTFEFGVLCQETISESQFLLESANYPEAYPQNLNCELRLKGQNCPTYYKFRFIDFLLEKSEGCINDRLEIDLIDAHCGWKNGTKTYLSKNGTLTLRFKTNDQISLRGYRILVTRIEECENTPQDLDKTLTTTRFEAHNNVNSNLKKCCLNKPQDSKRFILKSPNFPASMSYPHDCILQIQKASPDICRLRIVFQFFWFGNSLDCREGFMQIDGKLICGCRKGLKLISMFDENVKLLRFRSTGLLKNSYSGFIAEVFQDDCPKKVKTDLIDVYNNTALKLPHEKQDLMFYTPFAKKYFGRNTYTRASGKEKEQNEFLATEDINGVLVNDVNEFDSCLQWNQVQFNEIFYGQEIKQEKCQSEETQINQEKKCTEFFQERGFFFSPGYPFFYPGNLNICYRFNKFPGACGVRIHFFDFRIDRSRQCSGDRLVIEDRSYCGTDLWKRIATLDLRDRNFVELDFVTTTPKCSQGYKAYYEFLPCDQITTETPFPRPITKIIPVPPPTTNRPSRECGGVIREEMFSLSNIEGSSQCVFIIEKFTRNVCMLVLNFDYFSVDCSSEVVNINGKPYCGNQVGREVTVDVTDFPVEIVYSRFGYTMPTKSFTIRGIQDTRSCKVPEPPAELS